MLTEQEIENYRQQYYAGMRAMSKEQMEERALAQAEGIRQAAPSDYDMQGIAQLYSMRGIAQLPIPTTPLTRWQRFRQWWRTHWGTK